MIASKALLNYTKVLSVLFVEDHDSLRESMSEILKSFFKTVDSIENGESGLKQYKDYKEKNAQYYDIVITDIQMPKLSGIDFIENIYKTNPSQSIIVLSAFDDAKYLIPLINMGVEQFIKKPIDYQELLKILFDVSKKINEEKSQTLSTSKVKITDNIEFDREHKSLTYKNKNINLTKYEIMFINLLTTKMGKIYTNEDISMNYESFGVQIDAQNVRKLVSKLRKKLPDNFIESIYGIGYKIKLNADNND